MNANTNTTRQLLATVAVQCPACDTEAEFAVPALVYYTDHTCPTCGEEWGEEWGGEFPLPGEGTDGFGGRLVLTATSLGVEWVRYVHALCASFPDTVWAATVLDPAHYVAAAASDALTRWNPATVRAALPSLVTCALQEGFPGMHGDMDSEEFEAAAHYAVALAIALDTFAALDRR